MKDLRFTFRINSEQLNKLKEFSKKNEISTGNLINRLITIFLEEEKR